MSRAFREGAGHGAVVFAIYGLVEFGFLGLAPFLVDPSGAALTRWHWTYSAACLAVYIAGGFLFGGILGLTILPLARRVRLRGASDAGNFLRAALTLCLVLAIALPMARGQRGMLTAITLASCLPLAAGLAASAASGTWFVRLTNPWSVFLVALGGPWWWMALRDSPAASKAVGAVCLFGLAGLFAALDGRSRLTTGVAGIGLAGLGLALGAYGGVSMPRLEGQPAAAGRPDVVLIVMDTVRGDHTSLHGYSRDTTPNLVELARGATVYHRAVATSNYTLPAHASLFTGLYPQRHGAHLVDGDNRRLEDRFRTLAEVLAEGRYATACVSANSAYVTPDFGMDQGFHLFVSPNLLTGGPFLRRAVRKLLELSGVPALERQYQSADDINRTVLPLLDQITGTRRPFFLFVNYMDAHYPVIAPRRFTDRFAGGARRLSLRQFNRIWPEVVSLKRQLTKHESHLLAAEYDGAIAYVDSKIGELVQRLKRTGRFENALFIVTSDHGDALGERHVFGHGFTAYQVEVGIPLLVKYPLQKEPKAVDIPVSLVDIKPTVLDVVGFDVPRDLDGRSLRHGAAGGRVFSTAFPRDHDHKALERYEKGIQAVFSGPWKLLAYGSGQTELYKLLSDPGESDDLFRTDPAQAKDLQAALRSWLASTPRYSGKARQRDERTLERLKTLGYIQ